MGKKRNRKQSPLFYINQPSINLPQADMQKQFTIKNNEEMSESQQLHENDEKIEEVETEAKEITEEEVNIEAEQLEARKKKNFNEYTLEEKIKHLKLVPASVAKVKYEFITLGQSFKGYFLDLKGEVLFIHSISPRKKSVSIRKEDIIDIKRVGL
ncbi:hypothetical protein [Mesobacillus jeotgali]|uniref:hypothetical protein n=1 Tax=Mesobacillus jeotgali TaxID=129985 RepID=UPI0009A8DE11|nr:hypothetical protein [Mesobacillus jeotgali]